MGHRRGARPCALAGLSHSTDAPEPAEAVHLRAVQSGMKGTPVAESDPESGARVLIVDVDARVRESIVRLLRATADGITTMQTGDASAAAELARTFRPDVAVVDVRLPDVESGLALVRTLTLGFGIAVVGMSVNGLFEARTMAAGAIAFFDKGSYPDRITEMVARALTDRLPADRDNRPPGSLR